MLTERVTTESDRSEHSDRLDDPHRERRPRRLGHIGEFLLLMLLMFVYAGDLPPMVNEAHYLVKAKNFWQPEWCASDLFASSAKAHTTFYAVFGWPLLWCSFETTAWLGRLVGWAMLALGLQRLCHRLYRSPLTSLGVAVIWIAGIEYGNLAGEWVVGGIEAKVPAYGFVLFAMAELADRRWYRVWLLLGGASAFHVLSGGWSVVAAMLVWWVTERKRDDRVPLLSPALFVGGAIAMLGLVPALALTFGTSGEDATAAARIYAYFRIKHHLLPADFLPWWYVRHGLLLLATIALSRWVRLSDPGWVRLTWFTWAAVAIAAGGLVVGALPPWAPDLAARLLRFYWFRLTDAMVPLLFALLVMRLLDRPVVDRGIAKRSPAWRAYLRPAAIAGSILTAAIVLYSHSSYRRYHLDVPPSVSNTLLGWDSDASAEQQRQVFNDWLAVCHWVKLSTGEDEIFLTPRHQQTFKWYAERAEVVNWKDVPQDASSLQEWYRRFVEIFPKRLGTLRVTIRYDSLREFSRQYGVRYLVVDRRVAGSSLPLVRVYPSRGESNETYAVYRLPP